MLKGLPVSEVVGTICYGGSCAERLQREGTELAGRGNSSVMCLCVYLILQIVVWSVAGTKIGGVWMELARLKDPELRQLVEVLPSTVLRSWAESTVAKYGYTFQ